MDAQVMSSPSKTEIGQTVRLQLNFESTLVRVTEALKAEGFGILTEIDVKATLKKKLDVDFRPYKTGANHPRPARVQSSATRPRRAAYY